MPCSDGRATRRGSALRFDTRYSKRRGYSETFLEDYKTGANAFRRHAMHNAIDLLLALIDGGLLP